MNATDWLVAHQRASDAIVRHAGWLAKNRTFSDTRVYRAKQQEVVRLAHVRDSCWAKVMDLQAKGAL